MISILSPLPKKNERINIPAKIKIGTIAFNADFGLLSDFFTNWYNAAAIVTIIIAANNTYNQVKSVSVSKGTCIASPAVLSIVPVPLPMVAKNAIKSKNETTTKDT